ncbi:GNAT family N-acetyltransferase [Kitasatospora sp. NPDC092948]|uniref:GNAT family N-acetyltransferase n=1 Tax=Kitasatospora sp. NPDC092948 TaxID=3364088 RepID=UPI00382B2302
MTEAAHHLPAPTRAAAPPVIPATISTERLILRPFTVADADDRYAYQALPEVVRYLYRPALTREGCETSIVTRGAHTGWSADGDGLMWAVCRADRPGVLGEVVVTLTNARSRQAEIGWVFNPQYAGQGYATEAARGLVATAFESLGVHRLFARLDALNTASVRVCERLGMRREAVLVENELDGDRWGTECVYALLAREWNA